MDAHAVLQRPSEQARFSATRMTKLDCFRSARLLVGLNCFEAGQGQSVHVHSGADKFYFVVSGKARFVVGETTVEARAGDLVLAPEGVPHGVAQATERTVVLVGIAPAPTSSAPL
jgi:mannose-6-phosphate isomerase-like protein (cupin superfamily)